MPIRAENAVLHLEGRCPPEDAEVLMENLRSMTAPTVDLADCEDMHTAVLQILLALRPSVTGEPKDRFLADCLGTLIGAGSGLEASPAFPPEFAGDPPSPTPLTTTP